MRGFADSRGYEVARAISATRPRFSTTQRDYSPSGSGVTLEDTLSGKYAGKYASVPRN